MEEELRHLEKALADPVRPLMAVVGGAKVSSKIALLENEFSVEGGELTPTLKVRRRIVDEKYKNIIERMYSEG